MGRHTRLVVLVAGVATLALAAGCGSASDAAAGNAGSASTGSGSASGTGPASGSDLSGTVVVLAAASLTAPFTSLAKEFEAAHPGVEVKLSFGSSTTLAQQVAQGANADLFASAGVKALDQLPPSAASRPTTVLASNVLEIATPPGNPREVSDLTALADPGTNVVLCAATVPCGAAADGILKKAGVNPHVVSRELDVKATLAKVMLGEADAAIVYHSDVVSAGAKVTGVEIPPAQNTTLKYPLVTLGTGKAASAFAAYLSGPAGEAALAKAGFLTS